MDTSSDVSHAIVVTLCMDMSSAVAHAIVVTSYMDTSSDVAHTIVVPCEFTFVMLFCISTQICYFFLLNRF